MFVACGTSHPLRLAAFVSFPYSASQLSCIHTNEKPVEIIGYIGRTISTNDLWALGPYIVQSILLLIAPAFFAAAIYIVLGRIIRFVDGERHSLIRLKWLTKIFVTGDVAAFLLQMAGKLSTLPRVSPS